MAYKTQIIRLHSEYVGNSDGTNWKGHKYGKVRVDNNGYIFNGGTASGGYSASNLTIPGKVKLPSGETISVKGIGCVGFSDCAGLSGWLTIAPDIVYIGDYAFYNCKGFASGMSFGGYILTIGKYAFGNCCHIKGNLEIPEYVRSIGTGAFFNCKSFGPKLTIYGNVKQVGSSAFCGCESITKIVMYGFDSLPNWDGTNIFNDMAFFGTVVSFGKISSREMLKYLQSKGLGSGWNAE